MEKVDWPTIHTPVIPKSRVKGENLDDTGVRRKFEKKSVEDETGNRKNRDAADESQTAAESGEYEDTETDKKKKKKIDIRV